MSILGGYIQAEMPDRTLSSAPALLCISWQVECEVGLTYEPV